MEKKKTGKLRILLLTGGVLLVCTAALVCAIVIAGNAEENKIIKTAYAEENEPISEYDTTVEETNNTPVAALQDNQDEQSSIQDTNIEQLENGSIATTEVNENESDPNTTPKPSQTPEKSDAEIALEEYVPQIINADSIGPEHINVDEAINIMLNNTNRLFSVDIEKSSLSAVFNKPGCYGIKHATWNIYNPNFYCGIDALSGQLITLDDNRAYEGPNGVYNDSRIRNDDTFYTKAEEIIEEYFADGHEIDCIYIDGVQTVFNDLDKPNTYLVDCHVLMKSGPSYTISLIGPEQMLNRVFVHPTQHACVNGYYWEEEASDYNNNYDNDYDIEKWDLKIYYPTQE